jgi:hypothetical protein
MVRLPHRAATVLLALSALLARAGGATGLPELGRNSGARGAALGEAMVAVADLDAASANPAALTAAGRAAVTASHTEWLRDTRLNQAAIVGRHGWTVWGVSAVHFGVDGLEQRAGRRPEPLGTFGVYDAAVTLSLARQLHTRLRLGTSVRLIRQAVATASASGAAVDLGATVQVTPALQAAVAARYLGAMGKLEHEATELPASVSAGLACTAIDRVLLTSQVQRVRAGQTTVHAGAEVEPVPGLALRVGYQTADSRGLSAGIGLRQGAWQVDYAHVPFAHQLGAVHHVSVQYLR